MRVLGVRYQQDISGCIARGPDATWLSGRAFEDALNGCAPALKRLREAQANDEMPFLNLPIQNAGLGAAFNLAEKIRCRASEIVVLGTGGSSLGGRTLVSLAEDPLARSRKHQVHFFDNIDPHSMDRLLSGLDLANTVFITISKSGETPSTISQFLVCLEAVSKLRGKVALADQFVVITAPGDSALRRCAMSLSLHPGIGGRFSVLSLVGQLPAMIVGVDSKAVLSGSQAVLTSTLEAGHPRDSGPACGAALIVALAKKHGVTSNVLMPYCDRLQNFALWHRQLFAESLGKNGVGITPLNALGTVDQHSQLQLYLDGPPDKMFTFITIDTLGLGSQIDCSLADDPAFGDFRAHTIGDLMAAEYQATAEALDKKRRPVRRLHIDILTEETLGALLMHFMLEVVLIADLLGVNAFDQPAVEQGKSWAPAYLVKGE